MKPLTPYSLAFTFFRICSLVILVSACVDIEGFLQATITNPKLQISTWDYLMPFLYAVPESVLLYFFSGLLAKIVIWNFSE